MILRAINYDTVLCASRHQMINPQGEVVTQSIFPEVCKLNIKELDYMSSNYLKEYKSLLEKENTYEKAVLNVYVTGFSPALVSFINIKNKYYKELTVILWHYDNITKAYIPQLVL